MKKVFSLLLIGSFIVTSCGPRRYKCGPYRKCENEIKKDNTKQLLQKEIVYTKIS